MKEGTRSVGVVELDEHVLRRRFWGGGPSSSVAEELEREGADRLHEHIQPIRIRPERILDLGTGKGYWASLLAKQFPKSRLITTDIDKTQLVPATKAFKFRRSPHCGSLAMDARAHALAPKSIDLVSANMLIHWVPEYAAMFREAARVLRPGGLMMLSALGAATLKELDYAWRQVSTRFPHVHPFPDMHDVGDWLVRAGFSDVVTDAARITLTYATPRTLLSELQNLGSGRNAHPGRSRGLTTPRELMKVCSAYLNVPGAWDSGTGRVKATVELVFAHAWAPPERDSLDVQGPSPDHF